jgi:hypothetical protein
MKPLNHQGGGTRIHRAAIIAIITKNALVQHGFACRDIALTDFPDTVNGLVGCQVIVNAFVQAFAAFNAPVKIIVIHTGSLASNLLSPAGHRCFLKNRNALF